MKGGKYILEQLSHRIAANIFNSHTGDKKNYDVDDVRYGMEILINTLSVIILSVIVSTLLGTFKGTVITMISFGLLRSFSGGYHIKSSELCIVASTLLIVTSPVIANHLHIPNYCNLISLFIIFLFAPSTYKVNKSRNINKFYIYKIVSLLFILSNYLFISSELISLVFLIQSLTTITKRNQKR